MAIYSFIAEEQANNSIWHGRVEAAFHPISGRGRAPINNRGAYFAPTCLALPAVDGHDPRHPVVTDHEALLAQPPVHAWCTIGSV